MSEGTNGTGDAWGDCPSCGEKLCRENASRLRSGAVVHVGCQGGRAKLAAALRKGDAELPDDEHVIADDPEKDPPPTPEQVAAVRRMYEGPLIQAQKPTDYEALGRERYHDTPEAERVAQIPRILEQTKAGTPEEDRRFADGWLAEHHRSENLKKLAVSFTPDDLAALADDFRCGARSGAAEDGGVAFVPHSCAVKAGRSPGRPCRGCPEAPDPRPDIDVGSPSPAFSKPARPPRRRVSLAGPAPVVERNRPQDAPAAPTPAALPSPAPSPVAPPPRPADPGSAREAFVMMGPRGLAPFLQPAEAEALREGLADIVRGAAAQPKEDVVLQALHVAGEAHAIGLGEVRPPDAASTRTRLNIDVGSPEVGPDGTEVVEPPPLATSVVEPPVHMLVPGFPGHTCCGATIEGPSGDPNSTRPAAGTAVTTDRAKATCPDCLETYDDAEVLAERIKELSIEDESEEERRGRELVEELGLQAADRKARDDEQGALLVNRKLAEPAERKPDEYAHIFDGYPEIRAPHGILTARCGLRVRVPPHPGSIYSVELCVVPYILGHASSCPACGEVKVEAPSYSSLRSYGAFVPPDRIVTEPPPPDPWPSGEMHRKGIAAGRRSKR